MVTDAAAWAEPEHDEWLLVRGVVPKGADAAHVVQGEWETIFRTPTARHLLAQLAKSASVPQDGLAPLHNVQLHLDDTSEAGAFFALCVAISALHAFVQANWTGPDLSLDLVALMRATAPQYFAPRSVEDDNEGDVHYARMLHASALDFLTAHGEPAYHLCDRPILLVVSLLVLDALAREAPGVLATLPWWRLRAMSVHHRLLDEKVASDERLVAAVTALADECAVRSAAAAAAKNSMKQRAWDALRARALLETALAMQRGEQEREASDRLVDAAKANGLAYELSGALGRRTKFQKEDKTQLVLLAESREAGAERSEEATGAEATTEAKEPAKTDADRTGWQATIDPAQQVDHQPAMYSHNDDTLLEHTKFTATAGAGRFAHLSPGAQPPLAVLDQCVLLALCLNIHNTQPVHGLTAEQMGAFVERVISHPLNWSVHTMSLLLRSRLEAHRTRTVERSALQLHALIDQMPTNDSSLRERLRFFHALELPARWEMQAELARRYATLGVLRSALEIFERIELWEDVVHCLGLLGRQAEGIRVVRDLLDGRKTEADVQLQSRRIDTEASTVPRAVFVRARAAKLWCLLGDLEPASAEAHYLEAWRVSSEHSGRAARSLGAYHFALHAYEQAAVWLRRAVRINAVYSRSWFMLGCSYMRLERWAEGAAAFRKCTALDDEDGDSWNNLASCYLRMQEAQAPRLDVALDRDVALGSDAESEASTARDSGVDVGSVLDEDTPATPAAEAGDGFELRLLAHKALGISLKYNYESWRVWSNYMVVSVDVGLLSEAARALGRMVEIRVREGELSATQDAPASSVVDLATLNKLVDAVIRAPAPAEFAEPDKAQSAHEGKGLLPAVRRLFVDTLLPRFSTDPAVLQSWARLLFWEGEYKKMLDARLQSFRCGLGSAEATDVVTDRGTWLAAIGELDDLLDLMENLGPQASAPGSDAEAMPDWRFQSRTLVRNFLARTRDSYEGEEAWERLSERLAALRT